MGSALENYVNQVRTLSASGKFSIRPPKRAACSIKPAKPPPLFCYFLCKFHSAGYFAASYRELADELPESLSLLARNWSILDNVLETLDMQQHTLGVLYVLLAKLHSSSTANPEPVQLIHLMRDFVQRNNTDQLRFAVCACGLQYYSSQLVETY